MLENPEKEKKFAIENFIRKKYKDENFILDQRKSDKVIELIDNTYLPEKNNIKFKPLNTLNERGKEQIVLKRFGNKKIWNGLLVIFGY